jgi:two-component system, NarL family, nitrate/nitrite response regulator NarL
MERAHPEGFEATSRQTLRGARIRVMPSDAVSTRIFVIAEVPLYCESLAHRLSDEGGFTVVGTATSARTALGAIRESLPHIVLVDLATHSQLNHVRAIAAAAPESRIIGLAVPETEHYVVDCAKAGIAGYVPREASVTELITTLAQVQNGGASRPSRIGAGVIAGLDERDSVAQVPELTAREQEVLALVDQGLSNKGIARRLEIEVPTVKNHVHHILEKLHVHRRGEAAARAGGRIPYGA